MCISMKPVKIYHGVFKGGLKVIMELSWDLINGSVLEENHGSIMELLLSVIEIDGFLPCETSNKNLAWF